MPLKCIVRYSCADKTKYSKIKPLSETNKKPIISAKTLREKIGGNNHHEEQCSNISEVFEETHGIHMEPYYKK